MSLLHVRVVSPADLRDEVEAILRGQRGATNLVVLPGAAREPSGDLIQADLARECVQKVLSGLRELGVDRRGSISLHAVDMAIGDGVRRAERNAPGDAADAVIWEEVISSTGEDSTLTWVFMAFMVLACLLAAIGVATNSPITIVGAMVVGPEFGPLAGIAVGLRLRRMDAVRRGIIALVVGFAGAIAATAVVAGYRFGECWQPRSFDPHRIHLPAWLVLAHHRPRRRRRRHAVAHVRQIGGPCGRVHLGHHDSGRGKPGAGPGLRSFPRRGRISPPARHQPHRHRRRRVPGTARTRPLPGIG